VVDAHRTIGDIARRVRLVGGLGEERLLRADRPSGPQIIDVLAGREENAGRENAALSDRRVAIDQRAALKAASGADLDAALGVEFDVAIGPNAVAEPNDAL